MTLPRPLLSSCINRPDKVKRLLPSRFAVLVGDEVVVDDTLDEPSRIVEVWSAEHTATTVVKVIRLSEAQYGAIGVRSITAESDNADPVGPMSGHVLLLTNKGAGARRLRLGSTRFRRLDLP